MGREELYQGNVLEQGNAGVESRREVSTISGVFIVIALAGVFSLGMILEHFWSEREKKAEAKKREKLLREVWASFLERDFYEPLVYEAAKEVAETGATGGTNFTRWARAFRILELLGFTKDYGVRQSMSFVHLDKATKLMVDIKYSGKMTTPYMGKRTWSVLYLDENKDQITHLYKACRRDALAEFPPHQLVKAKEIQVHNPNGDLTDSLDVKENPDEIIVQNSEGVVLYRFTKPQELAEV